MWCQRHASGYNEEVLARLYSILKFAMHSLTDKDYYFLSLETHHDEIRAACRTDQNLTLQNPEVIAQNYLGN